MSKCMITTHVSSCKCCYCYVTRVTAFLTWHHQLSGFQPCDASVTSSANLRHESTDVGLLLLFLSAQMCCRCGFAHPCEATMLNLPTNGKVVFRVTAAIRPPKAAFTFGSFRCEGRRGVPGPTRCCVYAQTSSPPPPCVAAHLQPSRISADC